MLSNIYKKLELDLIRKDILVTFFILLIIGITTFFSAALGILNRNEVKFYGIVESQMMAYGIGLIAFCIGFVLSYRFISKVIPYFYFITLIICSLVFIPGIGLSSGGSTRWINFNGISLQPSELLKVSIIFAVAWVLLRVRDEGKSLHTILYFFGVLAIPSILMFLQKDFGTLLVLYFISFVMLFVSKIKMLPFATLLTFFIIVSGVYVSTNDYVKNRITDYRNNFQNDQGISYQNKQALIAIGNGGLYGRGIGQSVQKFYYLPEPAGDSVFAVYLEEYGFIGGVIAIGLFAYILIRSLLLSTELRDEYEKLLLVGIVMLIFVQTLLNMGSMINLIPISGDTLPLFSQGGTAIICNLFVFGFMIQLTKKINRKI